MNIEDVKKVDENEELSETNNNELYTQAKDLLARSKYPSAWLLHHELKISFEMAAKLYNLLANNGDVMGKKRLLQKNSVIAVRVTEDIVNTLDTLVAFSIAKSRSEAAYMLMVEGIKARTELLVSLKDQNDKLVQLRKNIEQTVELDQFGK